MIKRQYRPTSKEGENFIKPFKPNHKEKIKEALERLKIGGTHEEIAIIAGMRPDQIWKRLSELEREEAIFSTGITRKLKSGVKGIVWQLTGKKAIQITANPKTEKEKKAANTIKQLSLL
jgi:hypothetical protein